MNKNFTISIVIPNRNGEELLRAHLDKIIIASKEAIEIIIVDDHSTDNSVGFIRKYYPVVKVVEQNTPEGFAGAVNLGVGMAGGDIIVLLNTDVEPVQGYLKHLRRHFEDPNTFGVGFLDLSHEDGQIVPRGKGCAAWQKGLFIHWPGDDKPGTTAWVSGGSGAFRKQIWDKLGGMDKLFNPFYWEDIDISYRALKAGYVLHFDPKCVVHHYHQEGTILKSYPSAYIHRIAYRNQFIFIWKNLSDRYIWLEHFFWLPIRLVQSLLRLDLSMIFGFLSALMLAPDIVKSRNNMSLLWKKSDREVQLF